MAQMAALLQHQQQQLEQHAANAESQAKKRKRHAKGYTAPSQRKRPAGTALNDASFGASVGSEDEVGSSSQSSSGSDN